jgi:CRISPR/Cas system CSM-associated protein Csm2 small subunit
MKDKGKRATKQASKGMLERLRDFTAPLVAELDEQMDKRLVRTFVKTLQAIVTFRHSSPADTKFG